MVTRNVDKPTRLLLVASLAGGVATWWAVRIGMNSLEEVVNAAFGLLPPERPVGWYPSRVHAAMFAAPVMGVFVAAGIGWLGSALQRDRARLSGLRPSPMIRPPMVRPKTPGAALVLAGLALGLVVWWAIRISLNTLDDIAITGIGTDVGFDHGPRNGATYAAPFIGLLVVVSVISFGYSLLVAGKGADKVADKVAQEPERVSEP